MIKEHYTLVEQLIAISAMTLLSACGPHDSDDKSGVTPTEGRSTIAASTDDKLSFVITRDTLSKDRSNNWRSISIPKTQNRWLPTGLQVEAGMPITVFGFGSIELDSIRLEPRNVAWIRIGQDGNLVKLASNQMTLVPDSSGELYLTVPPYWMKWETPAGRFPESIDEQQGMPIEMDFIAVQWAGDPKTVLEQPLQGGDQTFRSALHNLNNPRMLPNDFSYLWFLGQSDVFDQFEDGDRLGVHGYADNNWGIIKKKVDLPLTDDLEIGFEWLYSTLPSDGPEDLEQYHDYLSIAVEFDNGQDITWFWSRFLDIEEGFRCPLPWWDERETHVVLQSGAEGLGDWHEHRRNILSDYRAHIGGETPDRVVGVWFIATSMSQTPGEAYFANVALRSEGKSIQIFTRTD